VYWHFKPRLESGPVTADLTTTVVHSYTFLINDVKPVQSKVVLIRMLNQVCGLYMCV